MAPRQRAAEGLFRGLLLLCPRWFRHRHGNEMTHFFLARLARARGRGAAARMWWVALRDMTGTAIALRRSRFRGEEPEGRGWTMDTLWQDVKHAVRHLGRAPVFTAGAVALLAIGIGANATVFSLVDSLLFRPAPWTNPEQVVLIYQDSDDGEPSSSSYPAFRDMSESEVFAAVAATTPASVVWEGPDGPVEIDIEFTTSAYLEVLGLAPTRGRWFGAEHDLVGNEQVAVLSHTAWQSRFGSDPGVIGSTLRLNGQPVVVIGVGPEEITSSFPPFVTDVWLSISSVAVGGAYRVGNLDRREDHWYDVRARLADGVTVVQARAAMDALAESLAASFPELNRGRDITVYESSEVRVHPQEDRNLFAAGSMLSAVVLVVLLLASANLANLLLVRGIGRDGEVAVRRAIGAGRLRVARLFLVESVLLSLVGGGLGLLLARSAIRVVPTLPIPMPGVIQLQLDVRVVLFSVGLMVTTGILFGLAPALRAARSDVAGTLRDEARTSRGTRGSARLRSVLVAIQVGASLILVLGTGLLARSIAAMQDADTGVDADRVAFVRTDFSQTGLESAELRVQLRGILDRVEALPGVTAAAGAHRLPAQRAGSTTTVVEGYTPPTGTDAIELDYAVVTDDYFATLGIPLLAGRTFSEDDVEGGPTVVLVNETAARTFWGTTEAVGRRLRAQTAETWRTVIGVVGDAPVDALGEPPTPMFYFGERQSALSAPYVVFHAEAAPQDLIPSVREIIGAVRPVIPVAAQGTLAGHFGDGLASPRLAATFLALFSLLAVVLAGLGIYAVVSFSVARRASELGIRMALGAERGRVVRSVVGEVVGTVVVGLAVGTLLSALVATRVGGLLYGIEPLDPATFGGAIGFLVLVAWLAAWLPARRVMAMDPVVALRAE